MSQHKESLCRLKNNSEYGIFILDTSDKIIFYNEEAYKMLGLNNKAILNQNIHDVLPNYQIKTRVGSNKNYEPNIFSYNDKVIWVTETTIRDNNSVEMGCIILQQLDDDGNFDCRLKNEIAEVSLLKTVMETTNDSIVYVNKDGNIELISKAYTEFLGTSIEKATGKHVTEVIENTRMHHVLKTGKPEFEQVQEIKGKKMIATRIPVFVDGEVVGAVGKVLFRNIDELNSLYNKINKIENELNLYKEEFKKINKAKYDLGSIVSVSKVMYDLKNLVIKASRTNSNVLISGESGTGKELIAHSIHMHSNAKIPFSLR